MMKRATGTRVRRFPIRWASAAAVGMCCPFLTAHAQETSESIDEIVVVVDRDGRPVDIDALRLGEARLKIIRELALEHHKQEEEAWRLKLRSAAQRNTSRIAWGYDAQSEAAEFRYSQANYLPIDRVRPATLVSIRF